MNIAIGITTYNRPDQYRETVKAIRKGSTEHNVKVVVVQDGGPRYVKDGKNLYTYHKEHGGKPGYGGTVAILWGMAKEADADLFMQVPDDFTYGVGWIDKAVRVFSIFDKPMVLNIHSCGRSGMWGSYPRERGAVDSEAFIDGAFLTSSEVMARLRWLPGEVPEGYHKAGLGSGVWKYTTKKIKRNGIPIYRMREQIVTTDWSGSNSQMNPHR